MDTIDVKERPLSTCATTTHIMMFIPNSSAYALAYICFLALLSIGASLSDTKAPEEEPVDLHEVLEMAAEVGYSLYRPGSEILADRLAHIPEGEVADSSTISLIERELEATGRALPQLWRDALTHPIGVQALKRDIQSSVLWVARVLWTESNDPEEFPQIVWVVRNRVETGYRGKKFYRTAILDKSQFSHFNTASGRAQMESFGYHTQTVNFQEALEIAFEIMTAPAEESPFSAKTRHYYSTVSMKASYTTNCWKPHGPAVIARLGKRHPKWAHQGSLAGVGPDPDRFRFIANAP
jgi:hypothetical protein